jgi:exopolyphosphatase/guanosine-5'-triphosphate,3'-diphosphate pyrophosphatase
MTGPGAEPTSPDGQTLGVVDIGSNSGRIDVVRLDGFGHLDVLETAGTPLRLVHELASGAWLGDAVIERTLTAVRGFQAIARGAGAGCVIAVATAAVREAANGEAFVQRLRDDAGLDVQIISGQEEARLGFLGAVYGLPVEHGVLLDIGGGSMQVAHFRDRCLRQSWSLPLGALRLSDHFLLTDPPTAAEIRRLQDHVRDALQDAPVPALAADEQLVGTGGTIRNLARMDRAGRGYPIHRLHGYELDRRALATLVDGLVEQTAASRAQSPGLNASRFDSIAGGALAVQQTLELLEGSRLLVSGQGLREGLALDRLAPTLQPPSEVRRSAVLALAARFASWDEQVSRRRAGVAESLVQVLDPSVPEELRETLLHAATALDIGRSIDLYNRHEHTIDVLLNADLSGFSHRGIALLGSVVRLAGKDGASLKSYAPLVGSADQAPLARIAAILALADAIVLLAPLDDGPDIVCTRRNARVALAAPWLVAWPLQAAIRRVQQIFAVDISVEGGGG